MRLNRLILHNYSVFEGTCEFTLTTSAPPKNVVIIGGKNGSGKTSILEAIRLCLYGAQGVSRRPGRDYRLFLQARVNRQAARASAYSKAFIELQFEHVANDRPLSVVVRRTWSSTSDDDSLYLELDGKELSLERDYWPEFLKLLIPPGVAQFFIFDGEKIQQIADEVQSDQTIIQGIKSLLGLDVFEQLRSDLDHYARQRLKDEATQTSQADYKKADADLEAAKQNLELCEGDLDETEHDISEFEAQKADLETRITRTFGAKVSERPQLLKEKASIDEQIKDLNERFLMMCGDLLPFAMLSDVGSRLEQRLDLERKARNWMAAKDATYPKANDLATKLFRTTPDGPVPELTGSQQEFLQKRLLDLWESLFVPPPVDLPSELRHELSSNSEAQIRTSITKSRGEVARDLRELLDRRERLASRLRSIDIELDHLPTGDQDEDLFREVANVNQTIGRLKEKRTELEDRAERHKVEIADCERRLTTVSELLHVADSAKKQLDLCKRIKLVIQEYLDQATRARVATLQNNVAQMLRNLVRKEDLVSKLEIEPKDFSVSLYGREGIKLRKEDLSAGEKEIYAICLLWGLAQTSGRELPIIIDTPLSRLDSDHRRSIVQKYYPTAGTQVIILSTDTEVDKEYYQLLLPSVERAYLLDYSSAQGNTKIRAEYFWQL